jgi:uncharacterized protein (DUF305 family)
MTPANRAILKVVMALIVVGFVFSVLTSIKGDAQSGNAAIETDGAFIAGMVPHHQAAVEMAAVGVKDGEHPAIRRVSQAIIDAQTREIGSLRAIHQRIFGSSLSTMGGQHSGMGGMSGNMGMEPVNLERMRPFDRAFIDAMVPHHEEAIRMARVQLREGEDPELRRLSAKIIDDQTSEIRQLRQWRERWYDSSSSAVAERAPAAAKRKGARELQTMDGDGGRARTRPEKADRPADTDPAATTAPRRPPDPNTTASPQCAAQLHAGQPPKAASCGA